MNKIKRLFKSLIRKILIKLGIIEEIQIIINDDLSGLESFDITVEGHYNKDNVYNITAQKPITFENITNINHEAMKGIKNMGCYIITKSKHLNWFERKIEKVFPRYKESQATNNILGTTDENGNFAPIKLESFEIKNND